MRKVKTESADGVKEDEYIKMLCKVKKNRFAKKNPYLQTTIFGRYGYGIDVSMEILELAIEQNIIEKRGGGNYLYIAADGTERKWRGSSVLMSYIDDNPDFMDEIKTRLADGTKSISSLSEEDIKATEAEQEQLASEFIEEENDED